mgnify:CR=1 FL=1
MNKKIKTFGCFMCTVPILLTGCGGVDVRQNTTSIEVGTENIAWEDMIIVKEADKYNVTCDASQVDTNMLGEYTVTYTFENKENQKETDYQREESIVPGFRTGVKWKKTLAGIYYITMGVYSVAAIVLYGRTVPAALLQGLALLIYGWLTVLLPFNFLHWMDHVPVIRRLGSAGRLIFGAMLFGALFFAGTAFQSYLNNTILHPVRF